jgi:antitoxin ParD1/3/4
MQTVEVSLTDELAGVVKAKVDSGVYGSSSEMLSDALRMMIQRDESWAQMDEKIRRGIDQADRGEFAGQTVSEIVAETQTP